MREAGGSGPNQLGQAGEKASGTGRPGQRDTYVGTSGRTRISDKTTKTMLHETKNVGYQHLSTQIKDGIQHALNTGRKYILWLRKSTTVSKPLQDKINSGEVKRKTIPGSK